LNPIALTLLALASASASCSQPPGDPEGLGSPVPSVARVAVSPVSTSTAQAAPSRAAADEDDLTVPTESFSDPQKNFDEVRKALLAGYYDPSITEDALYRAAVAGMLERVDPSMRKWNKLLSPGDLAELHRDLQGEVVGVGVKISFDPSTGYVDVLGAISGSPADQAGLAPPDKIVTIDGKLYKGLVLRDVVGDIRGKADETVTLSVLRGDKLVNVPLVRERVKYDIVTELVVDGDVGYVRIPSFNAKTPDALGAALADLRAKKVRGVVLDLRGCPGGSFDDAVASASELLPAGTTVVRLKKRSATEVITTKREPVLTDVPLAVLVDHGTSSGAELVAAALEEQAHAIVVGERTFGKWTVQTVEDLPNGYAIKYTLALFQSPSGKSWEGVGLTPTVEVDMPDAAIERALAITDAARRFEGDVQLRTAAALLAHKH